MELGGPGTMTVPPLLRGLCDDAALFPPGNAPLETAVAAHFAHRDGEHSALVGPFVIPADLVAGLSALPEGRTLVVSVIVPDGSRQVVAALDAVHAMPGVRPVSVEVAVSDPPYSATVDEICSATTEVEVYVEVPRGGRGLGVLAWLAGTRCAAKFRTGGIVADAHPGETELATAIETAVHLGVPFKATAGLHHAVRNTAPGTGFEQHGFLNLMLATHLAGVGADTAAIASSLADRDGARIVADLSALGSADVAALRCRFRSFGTCSIADPLADLTALGLIGGPVPSERKIVR